VPVTDDDGNPIRVHLAENDPSPQDFSTALHKPEKTVQVAASPSTAGHRRFTRDLERRDDPPKSCHCLWVSPVGPGP